MDAIVLCINVAACLVLAVLASWAVMSPAVQDGVVIKVGLVLIALGFAATAAAMVDDRTWALPRSLLLIHCGGLVAAFGYWWRSHRHRRRKRRRTDWMHIDSREVDSV